VSMKIMVVDDQPEVLAGIKAMLEGLGCLALTVSDSRQAAKLIQRESFDSIFVDVQMPHLDGFELSRLIRASTLNSKTPIVMLTDNDDIQTMRLAFKSGATYFLGKPVAADRIQGLYNAVLGPTLSQRRKNPRVPHVVGLNCSRGVSGGRDFLARTVDLSEGGLSFESSEKIDMGALLCLEFSLSPTGHPLRLDSKVVRLSPPNRYGVEFIEPSSSAREAIREFVLPPHLTGAPKTPAGQEAGSRREAPGRQAAPHQKMFAGMERLGSRLKSSASGRAGTPAKSAAYIAGMLAVMCSTYWVVNRIRQPSSIGRALTGQNRRPSDPASPAQHPPSADDAVESPSLTLSPAVILAANHPGQTLSQTLTINNQSGQELAFVMSAQDMAVQDGRLIAADAAPNGIAGSVVFSNPRLTSKPWRTSTVRFTLTMPSDSSAHSVLIVLNGTDKIPGMNGATLQASLGTLITFVDAQSSGQNPAAGVPPPRSFLNYSVSQWSAR
jgi:CheY-like chemotaxis protein